jgi:hypothetical protein
LPDGPWIFRQDALQTQVAVDMVNRARSGHTAIPMA